MHSKSYAQGETVKGDSDMVDDPCECESVCNLPPDALRARVATLRAELLPLVRRRQRLRDGIAWEFGAGAAMRARLDQFVEFERQCCRGVTFGIEELPQADTLRLTVRGADAAGFEALGSPASLARNGPKPGGGVARAAKAGAVGVVVSMLLCCGLPLTVSSVAGVALAAPLARFDDLLMMVLGAIVIAVPSWVIMQRRGGAARSDSCDGC